MKRLSGNGWKWNCHEDIHWRMLKGLRWKTTTKTITREALKEFVNIKHSTTARLFFKVYKINSTKQIILSRCTCQHLAPAKPCKETQHRTRKSTQVLLCLYVASFDSSLNKTPTTPTQRSSATTTTTTNLILDRDARAKKQ